MKCYLRSLDCGENFIVLALKGRFGHIAKISEACYEMFTFFWFK